MVRQGLMTAALFLIATLLLSGCTSDQAPGSSEGAHGSQDAPSAVTAENEGSSSLRCVVDDKTAFCGTVNDTVVINQCGRGSFSLMGSGNTVTVNADCKSIDINGGDNKVYLQTVTDLIEVRGRRNIVSYQGGDPEILVLPNDGSTSVTKN